MVLVPYESYNLNQKQPHRSALFPQPIVNTVVDIDNEMDNVLANPLLPPDEKAKLHGQLQQRYLYYQNQRLHGNPITFNPEEDVPSVSKPLVKNETNNIETEIINSAPKNQEKKARLILEHFKDKGVIGWTDNGELVLDTVAVPGSNIIDIVNSLLVKRKDVPYGMDNVIDALQRTNFPTTYITNNAISSRIKTAKERYLQSTPPHSGKKSKTRRARKSPSGVWENM